MLEYGEMTVQEVAAITCDRCGRRIGSGVWRSLHRDCDRGSPAHAVTLNIRGNSYRLKEKLKAGLVRPEEAEA
jgi:hypothetical protein